MSKTDKDAPYWVRASRPEEVRQPWHSCYRTGQACDLGTAQAPHAGRVRCTWLLDEHGPMWSPPAKDRRVYYWKPERSGSRAVLRDLAKSWSGQVDELDDSPVRLEQHRRSPYSGGWWD